MILIVSILIISTITIILAQKLYFYKRLYARRDFVFIPHIHKQKIILSPRFKKILNYDVTLDEFAHYFFENDVITLFKNLEKPQFSIYLPHKNTLIKMDGQKIGKNGYVIECHDLSYIKETETQWHDIHEKLKKQIEHFKFILNRLPVIVCAKTTEGVIHYCNKLYAQHLDKTEAEVIKEQLNLITQSHHEHLTLRGQRRFFEIENFINENDHITIGIDKTDYDLLKREFNEYLEANHNIFQQLSTPIAVFNNEHILVFFNKAYQLLFGFDMKFLSHQPSIGEILDDLRHRQKIPEPADFVRYKNMHKSFFNNLLEPLEETLHLANGKILRSVVTPQPSGGVLYMYEDITHHLQLEKEHKSLNAAQKEILDHLHEGVIIFGSDYRLRVSNPMILKMFHINTLKHHIDDFIDIIQTHLFSRQTILELFEKRTYNTGQLSHDISWAYTPLPDGSHLLNFFYTFQKTA